MNLFGRKEASMSEPEITGTEAIRRRVHARWRKVHLSRTALDIGVALPDLEAFAKGEKSRLPEAAMHTLTKEMNPNGSVKFDAASDRLIDTNTTATSMGIVPEPWVNPDPAIAAAQAAYKAALAAAKPPEPVRTKPVPPGVASSGRLPKRPGFA
jgi:hypothetical protein